MEEVGDARDEGSGSREVRDELRKSLSDKGGGRSENWTENLGYGKGQRREGE